MEEQSSCRRIGCISEVTKTFNVIYAEPVQVQLVSHLDWKVLAGPFFPISAQVPHSDRCSAEKLLTASRQGKKINK